MSTEHRGQGQLVELAPEYIGDLFEADFRGIKERIIRSKGNLIGSMEKIEKDNPKMGWKLRETKRHMLGDKYSREDLVARLSAKNNPDEPIFDDQIVIEGMVENQNMNSEIERKYFIGEEKICSMHTKTTLPVGPGYGTRSIGSANVSENQFDEFKQKAYQLVKVTLQEMKREERPAGYLPPDIQEEVEKRREQEDE